MRTGAISALLLALAALPAGAQQVGITADVPSLEYTVDGKTHRVERIQDLSATLSGQYAVRVRACPPDCPLPMTAAPGVQTVAELELLQFMLQYAQPGTGMLVDVRPDNLYEAETIPGAVNLPGAVLNPRGNPFFAPVMRRLGGRLVAGGRWDLSEGRHLLIFCEDALCGAAVEAIRQLISLGYPPERLFYYRGGVRSWVAMGFETIRPNG